MENVRSYYERAWGGEAVREARRLARLRREAISAGRARAKGRAPLLEIGPGMGEAARAFARGAPAATPPPRVVALDLAAAALRPLRSEGVCATVQGDALRLPFLAASFEAIYADSILMFLPLRAAFAEFRRVLRPGGRAVLLEPLSRNPWLALYRRLFPRYRGLARWHALSDLEEAARENFSRIEREVFYFTPPLAALPSLLRDPLVRLDKPLAERFAPYAWMVCLTCDGPIASGAAAADAPPAAVPPPGGSLPPRGQDPHR